MHVTASRLSLRDYVPPAAISRSAAVFIAAAASAAASHIAAAAAAAATPSPPLMPLRRLRIYAEAPLEVITPRAAADTPRLLPAAASF